MRHTSNGWSNKDFQLSVIRLSEGIKTLLNLKLSGVNPDAVAHYEFVPQDETSFFGDAKVDGPAIKLDMIDSTTIVYAGYEAQQLFDYFQFNGKNLSSLFADKQNALDSLKAFFATAFVSNGGLLLQVTSHAKQTAEQALSVLSA